MEILFSDGPIVACSTSLASNAAINLVRLSGFTDFGPIEPLFDCKLSKLKPRMATFTKLKNLNDEFVDEVVVVFFPAPHSYTGENVLEISVHGNILNTLDVVKLFTSIRNIRQALPGEFSYRALKNQKLTLSQIEGLETLLNATTKNAFLQGRSMLSGELNQVYLELYHNFLEHKASLELSTDFYEDVGEVVSLEKLTKSFQALEKNIQFLYRRASDHFQNLKDPSICLIGKPNAGKSSFFNFLLAEERAIVSDEMGTTRDFLTERIVIEDNSFRLVDTAGLRETDNRIEQAGITKTKNILNTAFFKIYLVNPLLDNSDLENELKLITPDLVLFTHQDLKNFTEFKKPLMQLLGSVPSLEISLLAGGPIGPVNEIFRSVSHKYLNLLKNNPILIERQVESIIDVYTVFTQYTRVFRHNKNDVGVLSSECLILGKKIAELIGIISPNDVLHHIFANFCIGK